MTSPRGHVRRSELLLAALLLACLAVVACGCSSSSTSPSSVPPSTTALVTTTAVTASPGPATTGTAGTTIAATTAPSTTAGATTARVALGRKWAPAQQGYGEVRPSVISNGGDPTGVVNDVHWSSWGGARATGSGIGSYDPPNKIVADSVRESATVVAFDLGTCRGARAYQAIEWYFPKQGQQFDPHVYINICTGAHVGDRG